MNGHVKNPKPDVGTDSLIGVKIYRIECVILPNQQNGVSNLLLFFAHECYVYRLDILYYLYDM